MPKSGSGWYFNLNNDLLVEHGFDDVRSIREKYVFEDVLRYYSCNISELNRESIDHLLVVTYDDHTFVVKTNGGPDDYLSSLMNSVPLKTTYIYKDPRSL